MRRYWWTACVAMLLGVAAPAFTGGAERGGGGRGPGGPSPGRGGAPHNEPHGPSGGGSRAGSGGIGGGLSPSKEHNAPGHQSPGSFGPGSAGRTSPGAGGGERPGSTQGTRPGGANTRPGEGTGAAAGTRPGQGTAAAAAGARPGTPGARPGTNAARAGEANNLGRDNTANNLGRDATANNLGRDATASNLGRDATANNVARDATANNVARDATVNNAARYGATRNAEAAYGTRYVANEALYNQAAMVRTANYRAYDAAMYATYANSWTPTNLTTSSVYTHPGYANLAVGLKMDAQATSYDYGGNVVVQPTGVFVNGSSVGTTNEYSQQASAIAATGASAEPAANSKWLPLGVFALVEGDATTSNDVFQLAVNPQGVLRGNYHQLANDAMEPISGSVDKQSQRAAWTIGKDKYPVYEAGVANLTQDSTTILIHLDEGNVRQMTLVRLEQPQK